MINVHFSPAGLDLDAAVALVKLIGAERMVSVKIHDLCDRYGALAAIEAFKAVGVKQVWVDYKLHDIPKTVRNRAQAFVDAGADIITVHTTDEGEMIAAALETGAQIYAVTVLSSVKPERFMRLTGMPLTAVVVQRAAIAKIAGAHGIVASCKEAQVLIAHPDLVGADLIIPGARSPGIALGDQARSETPEAMTRLGIQNLVVESEVVKASDPLAAFENFVAGAERGFTTAP